MDFFHSLPLYLFPPREVFNLPLLENYTLEVLVVSEASRLLVHHLAIIDFLLTDHFFSFPQDRCGVFFPLLYAGPDVLVTILDTH